MREDERQEEEKKFLKFSIKVIDLADEMDLSVADFMEYCMSIAASSVSHNMDEEDLRVVANTFHRQLFCARNVRRENREQV